MRVRIRRIVISYSRNPEIDQFIRMGTYTDSLLADIISSGINLKELIDSTLWFRGYQWLLKGLCEWPNVQLPTITLIEK